MAPPSRAQVQLRRVQEELQSVTTQLQHAKQEQEVQGGGRGGAAGY